MPTQENSASWDLQLGFNLAFKTLTVFSVQEVFYLGETICESEEYKGTYPSLLGAPGCSNVV